MRADGPEPMPRVRLEFDLDGEVYPELHAALSTLTSPEARAERLRQLAAAGLVWEKVRLHGAAAAPGYGDAAMASTMPMPTPAPRPRKSAAARKSPPAAATPLPEVPPQPRARPRPERPPAIPKGFVDLDLDVELDDLADATAADAAEVAQIVRELPVLVDVVVEPDVPAAELPAWARPDPVVPAAHALAEEEGDAYVVDSEEAGDAGDVGDLGDAVHLHRVPGDDTDADADAASGDVHVTALVHKPSTRSRLMRMKDRGLFKNG
jgi:hypothetical protein